ncbi:domain v domain-containing protein, partial [Cystoisospora suis]
MFSSLGGSCSSSSHDSPSSSAREGDVSSSSLEEDSGIGEGEEVLCAVEFSKTSSASLGGRSTSCSSSSSSSSSGSSSSSSLPGGRLVNAAGVNVVGVCIFDRRTFKLQFCEFSINNDLSILEGLLLQVRPACVISSEGGTHSAQGEKSSSSSLNASSSSLSSWDKKLENLVDTCQAEFIKVRKSACSTSNLHQDLGSLLQSEDTVKNHLCKELQLKTASAACASLISYARV